MNITYHTSRKGLPILDTKPKGIKQKLTTLRTLKKWERCITHNIPPYNFVTTKKCESTKRYTEPASPSANSTEEKLEW